MSGLAEPDTHSIVMETMACLLQAQTDAMVAQTKAVAVQHLPTLPCFTGEGSGVIDDGFDQWIERFHECAQFAAWTSTVFTTYSLVLECWKGRRDSLLRLLILVYNHHPKSLTLTLVSEYLQRNHERISPTLLQTGIRMLREKRNAIASDVKSLDIFKTIVEVGGTRKEVLDL